MLCTPILFLVFNRPDTTSRVFEEIRKVKPKRLYVAADGPRPNKEGESARVEQMREIASTVYWPCEMKTIFRDQNLGCNIAVSSALTWFFVHEEEGIILEDDCLPLPAVIAQDKTADRYVFNYTFGGKKQLFLWSLLHTPQSTYGFILRKLKRSFINDV